MIKRRDPFIDFKKIKEFELLAQPDTTILTTYNKIASPSKKYIFKIFNFECNSSKFQNIIIDTFGQVSSVDCQYLLNYKKMSLTYPVKGKNKLMPVFSMRYVSSRTLEKVLLSPNLLKKWKIENFMKCLFAVAEGMLYLHDHLICHGNLCSSNILIDEAEQCYLCDFGLLPIKKLYIDEKNLFNKNFKDPLIEKNEPTFENDVYSFGILICELFFAYFQLAKLIKHETFQSFISKSKSTNFNSFPTFFANLIQSCISSSLSERPSFTQIVESLKTTNSRIMKISVSNKYKEFIETNYFIVLASKGNAYAINKVGKMYYDGIVFKKDLQKAEEYFKQAALLNYSEAQNNYGFYLQEKSDATEKDLIEGARYLKLSAEQGNIHGMLNYGVALFKGDGVEKDVQKALEYLKKSADLDDSYGKIYYSYALLNNESTIDYSECRSYIRKALNQDNPFAFYYYGILLKNGQIREKNENLAFEYFKDALKLGYAEAKIEIEKLKMNGNHQNEFNVDNIKINKKAKRIKSIMISSNMNQQSKTKSNENQQETANNNDRRKMIEDENKQKISDNDDQQKEINNENQQETDDSDDQIKAINDDDQQKEINNKNQQEINDSDDQIKAINDDDQQKEINNENQQEIDDKDDQIKAINNNDQQKEIDKENQQKIIDQQKELDQNLQFKIDQYIQYKKMQQQNNDQILDQPITKKSEKNNDFQSRKLKSNNSSNLDKTAIKKNSQNKDQTEINKNQSQTNAEQKNDEQDSSPESYYYSEDADLNAPTKESDYLQYAESSTNPETRMKYYELAIKNNIPESYTKYRSFLLKRASLLKNKETYQKYAKIFDSHKDYVTTALCYSIIKDNTNFEIYYNKAKENKDQIKDRKLQFDLGEMAENQNELNLSLEMYRKSFANKYMLAKDKINKIEKKLQIKTSASTSETNTASLKSPSTQQQKQQQSLKNISSESSTDISALSSSLKPKFFFIDDT